MRKLKYIITFFNINGYYILLALISVSVGLNNSYQYSISIRFFLLISMILIIMKSTNNTHFKNNQKAILVFTIFLLLYGIKLVIEYFNYNPNLLHSVPTLAMYMIAFCVVPFLFYLLTINRFDYYQLFKAILYSGLIISIVFYLIYGELLKEGVGRLGNWQSNKFLDENISPLVLSYSSATTIALAVFALLNFKFNKIKKIIYFTSILIAMPSFLLGASRGSLIGLLLAFTLFIILLNKKSKNLVKILMIIFIFGFLIYDASLNTQSLLISRTTNLVDSDIKNNTRIILYSTTIDQFLNSPLLGGSIQNETFNHFPHNIFLESLTATGIFGFLALLYLNFLAVKNINYIIKNDSFASWIPILYILFLIRATFNGAIYLSINYWIFLALLIGYNKGEQIEDNNKRRRFWSFTRR